MTVTINTTPTAQPASKRSRRKRQDDAMTTGEVAAANAAAPAASADPTPQPETTTPEPKTEPAAEEIVEVALTSPRLVQYAVGRIAGSDKERWLDLSKAEGFDEETGVVRVRKSQAVAWKLA